MAFDLQSMLYSSPAVVLGLTVHEYAHAYAAYRLGDPTAKNEGRLSLNPIRHIDPLGFLFLMVAGFGWAKSVRFSKENLARPRRDEALIALAGPVSNLLSALLVSVLLRLIMLAFPAFAGAGTGGGFIVFRLLINVIFINYGLFVFNMIPLPPLDGSHLLFSAIPVKPELEAKLYRYGSLALMALVVIGNRTGRDFLPIGKIVRAMAEVVFGLLRF
jgi:Zn-dependent protease